jgi:hypothetical protein
MSAETRRLYIDYIVYQHLGMNYRALCGGERTSPAAIGYRTWALGVTPNMRAALETMTSDALQTAYDECNDHAGWEDFSLWMNELLDQQEENERQRQYHLSFSQKGGHAHRSRRQSEIIAACQDMFARNPKISAKPAYDKLSTNGHVMPNGSVVVFSPPIKFETFRTKYWPQRRAKCCADR